MYKLCKRLTASILCLSFFSLQMSLAETTAVLDNSYGGASISGSQGGFVGVDKPDANTANLIFNGDAVIDWNHLNVGNGQALNFENGSFAVLNNVLSGMSTIAGTIKGGQGTIIISNPNGMLMTAGGSINTSGALILTTRDMSNNATFTDGKLNINDLLTNSALDNAYSVISLNAGKIAGADINIIAKGINVINNSDITSSGNISFTTSDGANFVANHNGATLPSGYSINIADSALKAGDNGVINLVAGNINNLTDASNVMIKNGSFEAQQTNIAGSNIRINTDQTTPINGTHTNVKGNLTLNSINRSIISNAKIEGNTDIDAHYYAKLNGVETNNLDIDSAYYANIKDSKITGNLRVTTGTVENDIRNSANDRMFYMENTQVGGNLDATSETGYIHLNGGSVGGNANLAGNTRGTGAMGHIIIGYTGVNKLDIMANPEAYENSTVIGGTITAIANNGTRTDYPILAKGDLIAYSTGALKFSGGSIADNAILKSAKSIALNYGPGSSANVSTTIGGDLVADSGISTFIYNTNVDGNTTINAEYKSTINNLKTKNLKADAGYDINVLNSTITNDAEIVSGKTTNDAFSYVFSNPEQSKNYRMVYMENTQVGRNLDATSETGYIHLNGGSVGGNAILAGNTRGDGAMGHIIIGYKGANKIDIYANPEAYQNSTVIKGTINAIAKNGSRSDYPIMGYGDLIAYSTEDLKFINSSTDNNFTAKSANGSVDIRNSKSGLNTDLTAGVDINYIQSTTRGNFNADSSNGNITVNESEIKGEAVMNAKTGDVTTTASKYGSTADLKAGHDVNFILNDINGKLDAEAGHDVNYVTQGDINLNETQSAKLAIRAGNTAHIETINGNITVDSIKADTEVMKGQNIHLTADNDITFVGDNVINGNLIATSTSGNGFVAINGNSTKADNITVDKAKWVEIKNVETGHLNLSNFIIGHLIQSTFDSTEASNCSDTLYVHRLNTKVNGYDVVEDAITPTVAESVNNLIYYPYFPEEEPTDPVDPNYTDSNDAARILGYMREQGIDGTLGKDYAPIGFAAYDRAKRGTIYRAAGDAIYKDISQTVHVTKRFDLD